MARGQSRGDWEAEAMAQMNPDSPEYNPTKHDVNQELEEDKRLVEEDRALIISVRDEIGFIRGGFDRHKRKHDDWFDGAYTQDPDDLLHQIYVLGESLDKAHDQQDVKIIELKKEVEELKAESVRQYAPFLKQWVDNYAYGNDPETGEWRGVRSYIEDFNNWCDSAEYDIARVELREGVKEELLADIEFQKYRADRYTAEPRAHSFDEIFYPLSLEVTECMLDTSLRSTNIDPFAQLLGGTEHAASSYGDYDIDDFKKRIVELQGIQSRMEDEQIKEDSQAQVNVFFENLEYIEIRKKAPEDFFQARAQFEDLSRQFDMTGTVEEGDVDELIETFNELGPGDITAFTREVARLLKGARYLKSKLTGEHEMGTMSDDEWQALRRKMDQEGPDDEAYAILGLDPSKSENRKPRAIKKAYYKLMKELHPDKTGGEMTDELKSRLQKLNAVYDVFEREWNKDKEV